MQDLVSMIKVSVIWRGNRYVAEVNSSSSLKELGQELQKLTDVKEDTMRFIVPQNKGSKLLSPFSDEHSSLSLQEGSIVEGKPIRMMGASEDEVDKLLQSEKTDLRIVGFDEEEKRIRQRLLHTHNAPLKLPQGQYIFCGFRTLQIPGIELNPPASEALKRLHMLAADPGIVAIMNKHRWRVGIMTELAPVGYVGISPKCILGFNKNHGEEVSLRLRTDDLKGFRKYESIKKTLLHELAHMVYSEHDANFYALDSQLNQEAVALDWTKSRGHTLTGVRLTSHYEDDLFAGDGGNFSRKLGGNISHKLASASASSVAAAYRRLDNASASSLGASEKRKEPDLTGSDLVMHEETYHRGSAAKKKLDTESPSRDHLEGHEPYPDDHSGYRNKLEPDPDDSRDKEASQPEKSTDPEIVQQVSSNKMAAISSYKKPDPDGLVSSWKSGVVEVPESLCSQLMEVDCAVLSRKTSAEPDPDESEDKLKIKIADDTMEIDGNLSKAKREPDPDESLENEVISEEPDPDDNLVCPQGISSMKTDEPDPDDQELRRIQDSVTVVCSRLQKAIEMLRAEVSTMEVTTVLQTLFKIIRNVIEHPDETKYKRLRKANPVIQRSVVNYKAAMEILYLVGFIEDVVSDEIGKAETYLVLKRNDPGLLWLAKASLETCIAH